MNVAYGQQDNHLYTLKHALKREYPSHSQDEIIDLFHKVSLFLSSQFAEWWELVDHYPIWLDAIVLQNDQCPMVVRKIYRTLSEKEIVDYYALMNRFVSWLDTHAPDYQIFYWWLRKDLTFSPRNISLPHWDEKVSLHYIDEQVIYNSIDIQKVTWYVLQEAEVELQLDYLFDLFIKATYWWEKAQKVFFPYKSKDTPLKIFQYPNLRRMEDGTIVLLDVNWIQHVVRTLDSQV